MPVNLVSTPQDVLTYIDGALLVDSWNILVLPRDLRTAWSDVVDAAQAPQWPPSSMGSSHWP